MPARRPDDQPPHPETVPNPLDMLDAELDEAQQVAAIEQALYDAAESGNVQAIDMWLKRRAVKADADTVRDVRESVHSMVRDFLHG